MSEPPMSDRLIFLETCGCGATYIAGTPDATVLATWRAAHVEHEEGR